MGVPSSNSISKASRERISPKIVVTRIAGTITGMTIRKKRMPAAGAGDARGLFQRCVEIAKRRRQQHHFNAHRATEVRPDDAPE